MKTVKLSNESNRYEGGKRINTVTTETATSLSDDMATLASYQNALAQHQGVLERLAESMPSDQEQQEAVEKEVRRISREMVVLREAIAIQQKHIEGFEHGD